MPWAERTTDAACVHCTARGFSEVKLINETYYYDMVRFRWEDTPRGRTKVEVPGKGWKTVKTPDGSTAMISRWRCPHWPCKTNNPIRNRQQMERRR
jgi:hypothetical protein